jgi:hypothetical protein
MCLETLSNEVSEKAKPTIGPRQDWSRTQTPPEDRGGEWETEITVKQNATNGAHHKGTYEKGNLPAGLLFANLAWCHRLFF